MLRFAVLLFVVAIVAALFGFGGIASHAVGIAQILFFVFVILAVASFLIGLIQRGGNVSYHAEPSRKSY